MPEGYFVDNVNTVETEDYTLFGVRARFQVTEGASLFIDARNLTDEKYISSTSVAPVAADDARLFNPGEGRGVYFGVELRR